MPEQPDGRPRGELRAAPTDTLLHITDLHFWKVVLNPLKLCNKRFLGNLNVILRRRRHFLTHHATDFADQLVSRGVPQLLISGDLSSTALAAEFEEAAAFVSGLQRRGMVPITIPGNHDVYTFESVRARRFDRYFGDGSPQGGLPAIRTLTGGTPLLLVPTVCPNLISSRGRVTQATIADTVERLAECASTVLVCGHYPLLHETYAYRMTSTRGLRNAEGLRRALGESGKDILYLSGHVHRFSYVQDTEYPNLRHLTSGALFRDDPRTGVCGEYSELQVADGAFKVFRHYRDDEWHVSEASARTATA